MRHFALAGALFVLGCGGGAADPSSAGEPERHARRPLPQVAPGRQAQQLTGGSGASHRVDVHVGGGGGGRTIRGLLAAQKAEIAERATHHDERANEGIRDEALRAAAQTLGGADPADLAAATGENPDQEAQCDALADSMEEELGTMTPAYRAQYRSRCMQYPPAMFHCEARGPEAREDPECREQLATLDRERAAMRRQAQSLHQTQPEPEPDPLAPNALEPASLTQHN